MSEETRNLVFAMVHYALSLQNIKEFCRIITLFNRVILQTQEQRKVFNSVILEALKNNVA